MKKSIHLVATLTVAMSLTILATNTDAEAGTQTLIDLKVRYDSAADQADVSWYPTSADSILNFEVRCYSQGGEAIHTQTLPVQQRSVKLSNISSSEVAEIEVRALGPDGSVLRASPRERIIAPAVAAQALAAQVVSGLGLSLVQVDSSQFPFIYLTVRATLDGLPIDTLRTENFSVTEDERPQTDLFDVTPPQTGGGVRLADVVFLIDTSGSMDPEIAGVRDNVRVFADALATSGIDYRLGLIQFGQTASSGAPRIIGGGLTADKETFKNWVAGLVASGGTEPGFAAIRLAIAGFNFRPGAQKVFVLITDEDSDDRDKTSTTNLILANQVTVHTAVDCAVGTSNSDYCDATSVRGISEGLALPVTGPYDAVLDAIASHVANTYIVRYRTDNLTLDGIERQGVCMATDNSLVASVAFSYIPGGAPAIERTAETLALHLQPLLVGSSPTIAVRATDAATPFVQGVTLFVRTTGSAAGYTSINMTAQGNDVYSAAVPANLVNNPGIDYYIRATDGQVTSSDPSTDPDSFPYQLAVLPNVAPEITHTPPSSWPPGQDLSLEVRVADNTHSIGSITVVYRTLGQLLWTEVQKIYTVPQPTDVTETLVIPGSAVSTPAIQYYIVATDDLGVSRFAPEGGADNPYEVTVDGVLTCPTVTGISPTSGSVGTIVTITGTDLAGVTDVKFSTAVPAIFTVDSDTQISATVPDSALTGPITLTKVPCTPVQTANFTIFVLSFVHPFEPWIKSGYGFRDDWECDCAGKPFKHVGFDAGTSLSGAPVNTEVRASADGEVKFTGVIPGGWAEAVVLEHDLDGNPNTTDDRVTTLYEHVTTLVSENDKVKQGVVIAKVAKLANKRKSHLHFGFRRGAFVEAQASDYIRGALPQTAECRPCWSKHVEGGLPVFPESWEDPQTIFSP